MLQSEIGWSGRGTNFDGLEPNLLVTNVRSSVPRLAKCSWLWLAVAGSGCAIIPATLLEPRCRLGTLR
jgi:hypothetical protein